MTPLRRCAIPSCQRDLAGLFDQGRDYGEVGAPQPKAAIS